MPVWHDTLSSTQVSESATGSGLAAPPLEARVSQTLQVLTTMQIRNLDRITALSVEHVRFDPQKLESSQISGVEYLRGILQGYNVKKYLLEKFDHQSAYCGGVF
ncbi:MAG: RRXRR domain-containing protein [Firmicutes bacterium]|uniref:RRXRR domain-containing protein n=1 Tax=Sulfobacillus benefaciens TaxID=453960 RepID=A0A2T2XB18_9FIRM|nr:RRXRR domain-containing protein [Bacillota bacterium]PSR31647.1 MAG: hypothetical protein C7B43_00010 [Sulfobacillus benefaciens]